MVRCMRWHCPPDTGIEIRALVVWGQARYLSVTKAPHNIESLRVSGEETFCFSETWKPEWGSNPRSQTVQADSFNHCTRASALIMLIHLQERKNLISNSAIFGSRQHELRGALCRPKVFIKIFETIINDLVDFSSSFENGTGVMS